MKHSLKPLPATEEVGPEDKYFLVSYGWNPDETVTDYKAGTLRKIDVKVDQVDKDSRFSAKNVQGQISCSADSGGPLFVMKDGLSYFAGVVSGTQSGNLSPEQLQYFKTLPRPKDMSEQQRTAAMRKICNIEGTNFWTGIRNYENLIKDPRSFGLELKDKKSEKNPEPASDPGVN